MNGKCKYRDIACMIQSDIFSGKINENMMLPSIREYADKYSVATNTISQALHFLSDCNIIYSYRTKGYCVAENIEEKREILANELIKNLITDIQRIGLTPHELLKLITDMI